MTPIERSGKVALDAAEPRCHPLARSCGMGTQCARRVAPIKQGSPLTDYSLGTGGGTGQCLGFIDVSSCRVVVQETAPRVHPAIGSGE